MKILYIRPVESMNNGGGRGQERSLTMCKLIAGEKNVIVYSAVEDSLSRIKRHIHHILWGFYFDMSLCRRREILTRLRTDEIDVVYMDGSKFGRLSKDIKRHCPNVRIITFFHNLEAELSKSLIKLAPWYRKILHYYSYKIAESTERMSCRYSDIIMSLNKRDSSAIYERYERKPDYLAPVCLKDEFDNHYLHPLSNEKYIGLMIGSFFPPNVNGLDWFVNNVLSKVNIHLIVAGNKMDKLKGKYKDFSNIEIHGFVDNLNELYAKADFMIIPIFEGSGMKVKTAEAFEFGKFVIAAPEAMTGYDYTNKEAVVCQTPQEFINAITNFKRPQNWQGYVESSRDLFLKNYSYEHSLEIFKQAFGELM